MNNLLCTLSYKVGPPVPGVLRIAYEPGCAERAMFPSEMQPILRDRPPTNETMEHAIFATTFYIFAMALEVFYVINIFFTV